MKIYDAPNFLDLPEEVRGAFATGVETSFFNLPEWYDIVSRHGLEPGWRTRLYVSGNAAMAACVPASQGPREIRGCCNMYTIEHALLGDDADCIRRLVAEAVRENPATEAVLLPGLDPKDAGFAAALAGLKDAGFVAKPYLSWPIWFEPARGRDFESYLASRPSVLKNTWRRKLAALEKSERTEFRSSGDVERFIADYEDVYRRSWKAPEPFPDFTPALLRMAARMGALRFGILEAGGRLLAAQFWTVWKGRAVMHKLAYDEKESKFSPGTLLTMHMIREVLERDRPDEITFGRGGDEYKKLWMSARRERWGIEAANPRTLGGFSRAVRLSAAKLRDRFLARAPRS